MNSSMAELRLVKPTVVGSNPSSSADVLLEDMAVCIRLQTERKKFSRLLSGCRTQNENVC